MVVGLHSANWKEEWKYEYESFQYIQGVFEKSKRGNHYYKLGQTINETQYHLYHVTEDNIGFWVLGRTQYYQHGGYNLAKAVVRSRGSLAMGPSETGWEWVRGGFHDGRTHKYNPFGQIQSAPKLRVIHKKGNVTGEQLFKQGGSVTEIGVLCQNKGSQEWLVLPPKDTRLCDVVCQCDKCWDEVTCEKDKTSYQVQGLPNSTTGLFCDDRQGRPVIINDTDQRMCNFGCDCQYCEDELFCPWIKNISTQQDYIQSEKASNQWKMAAYVFNLTNKELWNQGGISTSRNIICLMKNPREWETLTYITRNEKERDPRYCNGVVDCKSEADEDSLCNFFIVEVSSTLFNISKEERLGHQRGAKITDENQKGPVKRDGVVCEKKEGMWTFIGTADPRWCNGRWDCFSGLDEQFCPWFSSTSIRVPIYCTLVMMALGILLYFVHMLATSETEDPPDERSMTEVMSAVDSLVGGSMSNGVINAEETYSLIHGTPGGVRMLIGSAFTFLINPQERHQIAKLIKQEEEKIHESDIDDWTTCLRLKTGNDNATQHFLDSLQPPGTRVHPDL